MKSKEPELIAIEELEVLTDLINSTSRQTRKSELFKLSMRHLTGQVSKSLFEYDYVVISTIDFFRNEIASTHHYWRKGSLTENPSKWAPKSKYSFEDNDVLTYILKYKLIIECSEGKVLNNNLPSFDELVFNEAIFHKYKHNELTRIFIPIVRREKKSREVKANKFLSLSKPSETKSYRSNKLGDYFLGIIELGYHSSVKARISEKEKALLKLYVDNIAQPYFNIIENEIRDQAKKKVSEFLTENGNDHTAFLGRVATESMNLLSVSKMDVSYPDLDHGEKWVPDDPIVFGDLDPVQLTEIRTSSSERGIFRHVLESDQSYISNDVKRDPYYIRGLEGISSQMSIPLKYDDNTIGVASYYHELRDKFNFYTVLFLEELVDAAVPTFFRLRLDSNLNKLIEAFDLRKDKFVNLTQTVIQDVLSEYFNSHMIGYFEWDEEDESYLLHCGTKDIEAFDKKNTIVLDESFFEYEDVSIEQDIDSILDNLGGNNLSDYLKSRQIRQIIFIPIQPVQGDKTALSYYAIFSARIYHDFIEDKFLLKSVKYKTESALFNYELLDLTDNANLSSLIIGYSHDVARNMETLDQGIDYLNNNIPKSRKTANFKEIWEYIDKARSTFIHSFNLFLTLSANTETRIRRVKVKSLINDIRDNFLPEMRRKNIEYYDHVDSNIDTNSAILIDLTQIRHVFYNLIRNAVQAIEISSNKKNGLIQLFFEKSRSDEFLKIKFTDNGIGFTDGAKKQAFKRRFTTKGRFGSGLGLILIQQIISSHGGMIDFESELGKGTEFVLELKRVKNAEG